MNYILIGIGGCLGAILRYFATKTFILFPFSPTLFVNLLGSFCIGIALRYFETKIDSSTYIFLVHGLLGGFTTYSTFSAETFVLLRNGSFIKAFSYLGISVLAGLLLCAIGYKTGKILLPGNN